MPAETYTSEGPLERPDVLALIQEHLSAILEIDSKKIKEGDSFADDLEADSLALIELVELLEEDLSGRGADFRIEDEDMGDLRTVRDAVDYIHTRLSSES